MTDRKHDVGGLNLGYVVSHCMEGGFSKAENGCLHELVSQILYVSEAWCLKDNMHEMTILCRLKRSIERVMCGIQPRHRKISKGLMLAMVLNATVDQLAIVCRMHKGWFV